MIVQIVRFKSRMSDEDVLARYEERANRYRALDGLKQKLYLRYPDTGEHGAVYVWESQEALDRFRSSNLRGTIGSAYEVEGTPEITLAEVVMALRGPAV